MTQSDSSQKIRQTTCTPRPAVDTAIACDECGAFGAFAFDGVNLCPACYSEKGSCCPEFGKDDLWQAHDGGDKKHLPEQ